MRFQPHSDEEIQSMSLCPEGQYPFQVVDAKSKVSQKGNDMIELSLRYWDANGRERLIFDYLLDSMAYKLKHFCKAVGMLDAYESGVLDHMQLIGKQGHVEISIQKERAKEDGSGMWAAKNNVKDYVVKEGNASKPVSEINPPADGGMFNDDIPF